MTDTQLLIQTIRSGLGLPLMPIEGSQPNWSNIYHMAARQGVTAIAWDGVQRYLHEGLITSEQGPDKATKLQWALAVEQTEKRYSKQLKAIAKLADIYNEEGIKMLILKGYGLSLIYPVPEHRRCSDVDIWLFGEQQRADDIVRKKLNCSAQQYIRQMVVKEAAYQLRYTKHSIGEIGYNIGFKYPHHFTRVFKQEFGATPQEYRNKVMQYYNER